MNSIKSALGRSLHTEEKAINARFEKADKLFEPKPQTRPQAPERVIRDSFTLPSDDYQLIKKLRTRCLESATNATNSEIIRAGLHALQQMSNADLVKLVNGLDKVKTGRPVNTI